MSLADRLAQARTPTATVVAPREHHGTHRRSGRSDPFATVKRSVHEGLLEVLGPTLYDAHLDQRELELQVMQTLQAVLQRDETPLTSADRSRVAQEVADEILGHGPLEPYLRDPEVSEIMVNGYDQIYVEREGRIYPVPATFTDESHLRRTIEKIVARVGRRVDESSPMVDARLPDGSRVNAVIPPIALDGSLHAQRAVLLRPRRRADRHDRGRRRAAAAPRACAADGIAPGEPGGLWPGLHSRPGAQRAADATRPDHHR
jgi:pilus assembly protein CpaF